MFAQLNFLRPMAARPSLDITGAGRSNLKVDSRQVDLADADAQDPTPNLASHGFGAIPFSTSLPAGDVDQAFRVSFANLCAAVVKEETGATMVIGVPMAVQVRRSDGADQEAPVPLSHTAFTPGP